MTSFSALQRALSSLHAQRHALDVTGQNIANANTEGYSRQRVTMAASGERTVPSMWSTSNGIGTGVEVSDVERIRDAYLERRAHTEHGALSSLAVDHETFADIEQAFAEPSDTALQAQLADFWAAWGDLANSPGDLAARSQVIERSETLASGFRAVDTALTAQWDARREQLVTTVDAVNTAARQVADLNSSIVRAVQSGVPANDLMDQRDKLVMQMADLAGVTARSGNDGAVDVFLGGIAVVEGRKAVELQVEGASRLSGQAADPVTVTRVFDGQPVNLGGRAGAMVSALGTTIPSYVAKLDTVVAQFATAVNTAHATGTDLYGAGGVALFSGSTAATLRVAVTDGRRLAAAAVGGGPLSGGGAQALADIGERTDGPDLAYRQLVVGLGVQAQTATRRADIQSAVVVNVDAARESQAGVNLDEEMVNMVSYQRAYEAAARVMTSIDDLLDTLVNRTGIVGR